MRSRVRCVPKNNCSRSDYNSPHWLLSYTSPPPLREAWSSCSKIWVEKWIYAEQLVNQGAHEGVLFWYSSGGLLGKHSGLTASVSFCLFGENCGVDAKTRLSSLCSLSMAENCGGTSDGPVLPDAGILQQAIFVVVPSYAWLRLLRLTCGLRLFLPNPFSSHFFKGAISALWPGFSYLVLFPHHLSFTCFIPDKSLTWPILLDARFLEYKIDVLGIRI